MATAELLAAWQQLGSIDGKGRAVTLCVLDGILGYLHGRLVDTRCGFAASRAD